jgi:hypothetical protein
LEVGEDVVVGDLVELDGSFRVGGRIKAKTLNAFMAEYESVSSLFDASTAFSSLSSTIIT